MGGLLMDEVAPERLVLDRHSGRPKTGYPGLVATGHYGVQIEIDAAAWRG